MIHEKSNFPKPGDMRKEVYDQNGNGTVDNAERVNGHTVESDVPDGAVFTDTTYSEATSEEAGLMSASDKEKLDRMVFDEEITEDSGNLVTSGAVYTALAGKQDMLTVDGAPTEGSTNPVASGGVYTALAGKQDRIQSASVIRVYLNGQEMDIASALNAIVGLTGTEQNVVFSCDQTSE